MSTLQSDINNCQERSRRFAQIHAAQVTARKKQLRVAKVTKYVTLPRLSVNTWSNTAQSEMSCESVSVFVCGLVSAPYVSQCDAEKKKKNKAACN